MAYKTNMQQVLTSSEIQLLMVVVMAGPLLALVNPDPDLKEIQFGRLNLNDVLFTEDVLLKVSTRSRIECSKKCVETEGCVMCTFLSSPQGPPGHCRLHSQLQNAADVKESKPGARSVARKRRCDGGYELVCDLCLKAVASQVTYNTAKQGCSNLQGHLVMPRSPAEASCIWSFRYKRGLARTWIGADGLGQPGVFRWNNGSLLPKSDPLWAPGQPDSQTSACVYFHPDDPGLSDFPCYYTYYYICQKDVL